MESGLERCDSGRSDSLALGGAGRLGFPCSLVPGTRGAPGDHTAGEVVKSIPEQPLRLVTRG